MKLGKVWRAFFVTLVLIFSATAIFYALMMPKPSEIDFDFVRNHVPNHLGLESVSGPAYDGAQYASYFWKESFAKAEAEVTTELLRKGWHKESKVPNEGFDVATFFDGKGGWIYMIDSGSPDGKNTPTTFSRDRNPNSVTVEIIRPLPPGLWSKLRVLMFARKK
ncbi:MAG: hypothetical protein WCI55_16800 [Armatimonadota bacterium]